MTSKRSSFRFGIIFAVLCGTILTCLALNAVLIRGWWMVMDRTSHSITVKGVERGYELTQPEGAAPMPLVILLHGATETAKIAQRRAGFDAVAAREHFIVAYPNGIDRKWNVAPPFDKSADMDFIEALVDDLVKRGVADPKRVYLTGESNGGQLTFLMACKRPGKFAGMAAMIATVTKPVAAECKNPKPMPMLIMDATNDGLVLWGGYDDADPNVSGTSVADSLALWKHANGCSDTATEKKFPHLHKDDPSSVTSKVYTNCNPGEGLALYTIIGGGHQTPSTSGDDSWNSILGPRNHDIEAADELWNFFSQFKK